METKAFDRKEAREIARRVVHRLRATWSLFLFLPILYLAICLALDRWVFSGRGVGGYYPLSAHAGVVLFVSFACLAAGALLLLWRLGRMFQRWMVDAVDNLPEFIRLLRRRLIIMGGVCDTVSFLGLAYFLINGDLRVMAVFGAASYFLYLMIMPRDAHADLMLRRRDADGQNEKSA